MIATKQKILSLLGDQPYQQMMLVDRQDTGDIIEAILNKHEKCTADYDKFSFLFDGGSLPDICKRLYDFCRDNIAYVVEKNKAQYTSKPGTILRQGYADCKCYSLFIGGVLDSLKRKGEKIKWAYRFASYRLFKKAPHHVFIVVFYQGQEIYIDPVFKTFDYRMPAMWLEDYIMTAEPAQIAGMYCDARGGLNALSDNDCECDRIGSTTSGTGLQILAISAKVATIPVAGWIVGAAGAIAGGILAIVGSKWAQSPDVRWLTQLYEYYVTGNPGATSDNKTSPTDDHVAQAYFSVVLGVPIGGRKDFNILQSGDGNTNTPTGQTAQQRATNYLAWKGLAGQIPMEDAVNAATIAAGLNPQNYHVGDWAGLKAAPWTVQQDQTTGKYTAVQTAPVPGTTVPTTTASLFSNKWVLIGLVAAGVLLLTSQSSHPKKRR